MEFFHSDSLIPIILFQCLLLFYHRLLWMLDFDMQELMMNLRLAFVLLFSIPLSRIGISISYYCILEVFNFLFIFRGDCSLNFAFNFREHVTLGIFSNAEIVRMLETWRWTEHLLYKWMCMSL